MKTLVLAAGKSTRIHSVSGGLPKPLIEIGGSPILGHTLRWLHDENIKDVWINLHYKGDLIQEYAGTGKSFGLNVRYSYEDPIMGTAGAVWKLREEWNNTILVVYGDNICRFSIEHLLKKHKELGTIATLALYDQNVNLHTGIAGGRVQINDKGYIKRFIEGKSPDAEKYSTVNAAVYVLEPEILSEIPSNCFYDFGTDLFPRILEKGIPLGGYLIEGFCLGVDTPDTFKIVRNLISTKIIEL